MGGVFFRSNLICDPVHDDFDSFSKIVQDAYVDITEHSDPDAEIDLI